MESSFVIIMNVLKEDFSIVFFDENQDDFSINDYISDSIMYIQFIVLLEEKLKIEFPDEFLSLEVLDSAREFAQMIDNYIQSQ